MRKRRSRRRNEPEENSLNGRLGASLRLRRVLFQVAESGKREPYVLLVAAAIVVVLLVMLWR